MTQSKLGGVVPIPKADWSELVIYQLVGLTPMTDELRNSESLRVGAKMSEDYRRELERQVREGEVEQTAFLSAKILGLQDKARYFLLRARELEEQAGRLSGGQALVLWRIGASPRCAARFSELGLVLLFILPHGSDKIPVSTHHRVWPRLRKE